MQRPGDIEKKKKKIHAIAKVLKHGIENFIWASSIGREEVCGSREK